MHQRTELKEQLNIAEPPAPPPYAQLNRVNPYDQLCTKKIIDRDLLRAITSFEVQNKHPLTPEERAAFIEVASVTGFFTVAAVEMLTEFVKQAKREFGYEEIASYRTPLLKILQANNVYSGVVFDSISRFANQNKRALTPDELANCAAPFAAITKKAEFSMGHSLERSLMRSLNETLGNHDRKHVILTPDDRKKLATAILALTADMPREIGTIKRKLTKVEKSLVEFA